MFDVLRIRRYEKLALCEFDAFPIAQMRVQRNKSWPIPYKLYFDIFFYWLLEKNERNTTVNPTVRIPLLRFITIFSILNGSTKYKFIRYTQYNKKKLYNLPTYYIYLNIYIFFSIVFLFGV